MVERFPGGRIRVNQQTSQIQVLLPGAASRWFGCIAANAARNADRMCGHEGVLEAEHLLPDPSAGSQQAIWWNLNKLGQASVQTPFPRPPGWTPGRP